MVPSLRADAIAAACKRYGPGRLPLADRRDVGAGYAGASAAVVAIVAFALVAGVVHVLNTDPNFVPLLYVGFAAVAAPFVVPAAFVSGVVVWRVLPARVPLYGAVGGLLAVLATYVVAAAGMAGVTVVLEAGVPSAADVSGAIDAVRLFWTLGFLLTCWVTLPLGCLCGFVYDRVGNPTREPSLG